MDSCAKEMVLSGRNHPSIYAWGLYNEPVPIPYVDFTPYITTLRNMVKSLDTTRATAMANINYSGAGAPNGWNAASTIPDVVGLNYSTSFNNTAKPWLNTENTVNFYRAQSRGSPLDLDTSNTINSNGNAAAQWSSMSFTTSTSGQLAGGHFWCFKDYNSGANTNGFEGMVDRLTVPKTAFYMFREKWTNQAPDYPRPGTATKIDLQADTNSLGATGADIFLLTATMRDANNRQISTATGNVTFTVSPTSAATIFGGNSVAAPGGRAGAVLRTTTTASTMTITAAYSGLPTATLALATFPVSETYTESPVSAVRGSLSQQTAVQPLRIKAVSTSKGISFQCPPMPGRLSVVDCMGKTVYSTEVKNRSMVFLNRRLIGFGLFYGVWDNGNQRAFTRVNSIN
jgi:hypothetical protein